MQLRYYQQDAINAAYAFLQDSDQNPVIEIPTGGGKTPVIATICRDTASWGGRVLALTSSKELIEQTHGTIGKWFPDVDCGIYSAKLRRRDLKSQVLVCSINSVYKRGLDLCGSSPFDLVLVDEAHEIPVDGDGMYRTLLSDLQAANDRVRVLGLTASPFRTTTGYVCSPDHFLNEICYSISVRELVEQKFLSNLTSKTSVTKFDVDSMKTRNGEFTLKDLDRVFSDEAILAAAVQEIEALTVDRKSVLIFAASVEHAHRIESMLVGYTTGVVTGRTGNQERDRMVSEFREGRIKYLINVNCLTTGFDAPNVDCVVLLRSTMSPGLYYQMVGRGLRLWAGKQNCLILDFGENIMRHGPIDNLRIKDKKGKSAKESDGLEDPDNAPVKICSKCQETVAISMMICPECGALFPPPKPKHQAEASSLSVLGTEETQWEVTETKYFVHQKRGADEFAPKTMRVSYFSGFRHICDEFVCVEHKGFAWNKAFLWWQNRTSIQMPDTAQQAVDACRAGELREPSTIWTTVDNDNYRRISRVEWGYVPRNPGEDTQEELFGEGTIAQKIVDLFELNMDDIPF